MSEEKRFTYALGDSWLMYIDGIKAVWTVIGCAFRERDEKETYKVDTGDGMVKLFTLNRLNYRIHMYGMKRLKTGRFQKYSNALSADAIRKYYANLRWQEEQRAERVNDLLDSSREYREIKGEISSLSLKLAKAEYSGADTYEIAKLKTALETAKKKRQSVLSRLGIAPEDLKKKVYCAKCGDTGYTPDGKECACVKVHEREIREYAGAEKCRAKS